MRLSLTAGWGCAAFTGVLVGAPEPSLSSEDLAFFEKRIRPVLVNECYQCHSAEEKIKAGLRVDTREGLLAGGDSGPALVPGKPEESLLVIAVRHTDDDLKMPEKRKLSERAIADLTRWVEMGAPDPRVEPAEGIDAGETVGVDYEQGRTFWSFQPPVRKPAPAVSNADWPRNEIDRHLLAAMEAQGLVPVADADRRTLVRRLYFDLLGLPPTPAQLEAALQDPAPDAIERLVDELLASPRFGERWGRHWLDVARYSESNGMERNFTYPHAWRYRDYVIDSFNKDKPYDQFVREQIAGDLLEDGEAPGTSLEERLVATGFLALGPKILNERDKDIFQMEMVDEQIDASTRAVLGLTVSCARCHDHKFDPIAMEDYYALAGIFTSTRTLYGTKGGGGNRQAAELMAIGDESPELAARRREHRQQMESSQKQLGQANKQVQNLKRQASRLKGNTPKKEAMEKRMDEMQDKVRTLQRELAQLRKSAPPTPDYAMGVEDGGSPADCELRLRGDAKKRGPAVPRGFLKVIPTTATLEIGNEQSGRRELAEWMVGPGNPLAARVMVNRIWHHLFGSGLVRTVDNFGTMGEPPVNPDLLDHLALRFMDSGWSVKSFIREVVLSRSYQLSSAHHAGNYAIDPENRACWQMTRRRLSAEAIRDAILQASGTLDLDPFEGSVVQGLGDVNYGQNGGGLGSRSEAVEAHRSVYLPIIRNAVPDSLRVFDFAEPSLIVGRRDVTTVPTQALFFLNDPLVLEHSERLAQRLLKEAGSDAERVDLAYTLTLSRPATTLERERALDLVREVSEALDAKDDQQRTRTAWATLAQSLMATAEFRYLD